MPSLRHCLVAAADNRTAIRRARDEAGTILTRVVRDGAPTLDPQGLLLGGVFRAAPDR